MDDESGESMEPMGEVQGFAAEHHAGRRYKSTAYVQGICAAQRSAANVSSVTLIADVGR